jgi:hypothetical protein
VLGSSGITEIGAAHMVLADAFKPAAATHRERHPGTGQGVSAAVIHASRAMSVRHGCGPRDVMAAIWLSPVVLRQRG